MSAARLPLRILAPFTGALVRLMHAVLRRPRVKRAALGMLALLPGLEARLHGLLHAGMAPAAVHWRPAPGPGHELPPRAARMLGELRQALQAHQH